MISHKNYLEVQKKFFCIKNILIQPLEVQKPETEQKTGPRTSQKFLWMNQNANTNLPALKFFQNVQPN